MTVFLAVTRRALGLLVGLIFTLGSQADADSLQVLALTGQPAPGGPSGAVFLETGLPDLNNRGQVAFAAAMEPGVGGVTVDGALGLWVGEAGQAPTPRVVGDAPAAGVPGGFFEDLAAAPSITNDGSVIAEYILEAGPGGVTFSDDWGRWVFSAQGDAIIYREGSAPPGVDPQAEIDLSFGPNNRTGGTGMRSTLRVGPGGVTSLTSAVAWKRLADGTTSFLARTGFLAPGTPDFAFFESVAVNDINDLGVVVSRTSFLESFGSIDETNDEAIYSDRSGEFTLVYREGDLLPGGVVFADVGVVQINNRDRLLFTSELPLEPGGSPFPDEVIWTETDSGLEEAFRTGQTATGTGSDTVDGFTAIQWNDAGSIAFAGTRVSGFPEWVLSNGLTGDLRVIAQDGEPAPGIAGDVRFDSDLSTRLFGVDLVLNSSGQVAFSSALLGVGVDETNDTGLWAQDLFGDLQLVVREGDAIEIAPGDERIVADFAFGGFNDRGQVAFNATFTDGTFGIFLSDVAAHLPGDYNGDGVVDAADYTVWRDANGQSGFGLAADGDGDDRVDAADYEVWRANYGRTSPALATAVPEPAGAAAVALAFLLAGLSSARR